MIQVKVRSALPPSLASPANLPQDVRDFVLHLLSDEKAQQWLYVAVRPPSPFLLHP